MLNRFRQTEISRRAARRRRAWPLEASAMLLCAVIGMTTSQTRSLRAETPSGSVVVVKLNPEATAQGKTLRLGDIAEIAAANEEQERRFREVDLVEVTVPTEPQRIGRRFIDLRLQLAGFQSDEYQLVGPDEVWLDVAVTPPTRPTDASLEEHARKAICRILHVPETDLRVTLSSPVMESLIGTAAVTDEMHVDVVVHGQPTLGRNTLLVRLFAGEQLLASRTAQFDIARQTPVLVAAVTLARGDVVTNEMLREESRFLVHATDSLLPEQVVGQKLSTTLPAGEIVQLRHVQRNTATNEPNIVQANDIVRVTARKGGLVVVMRNGEAMQSGRMGQLIRIRNPDTKHVIVGRVVASGEVEVSFD